MATLTRRGFGQLTLAGLVVPTVQAPRERRLSYVHLDVFTDRAFEGNQLLVFLEPAGLSAEAMLTLTRESNYSECTFVFPPEAPGTDYRVRIFMRSGETPFAGHPTIGTAFALASAGSVKPGTARTVFGLGAGPTPIDFEWDGPRLTFAWMTQLKPTFGKTVTDAAALAAALGLEASMLAIARVPAQEVNCGSTFVIVPVATRKAVDSAMLDRPKIDALFAAAGVQRRSVYILSTEAAGDGATAYSRLLGSGGLEDPATGSAAGPAGAFLATYGFVPRDRAESMVFLQGVLVGRPSRLHVKATMSGDAVSGVKVGGASVVVGSGGVSFPLP